MKPSIGRKVYCIYNDALYAQVVGYVGKDSFIVEDFTDNVMFDSLEWFYEDYKETWFTCLEIAKNKLLKDACKKYGKKLRIVKIAEDYYELEE